MRASEFQGKRWQSASGGAQNLLLLIIYRKSRMWREYIWVIFNFEFLFFFFWIAVQILLILYNELFLCYQIREKHAVDSWFEVSRVFREHNVERNFWTSMFSMLELCLFHSKQATNDLHIVADKIQPRVN